MPGGKGKIDGKIEGKQFSKTYQPQIKWTEKRALELGESLLEWLREDDENMFINDFLVIVNDYDDSLVNYLSHKFSSFSELIKKTKTIQETKLVKFGVLDRLNAQMTKFVLINNHDWKDKKEIDANVKTETIIIDLGQGKDEPNR